MSESASPTVATGGSSAASALRRQLRRERLLFGGVVLVLLAILGYQNFLPRAWAIRVDGRPIVALPNRTQAEAALQQLREQAGGAAEVKFAQAVTITRAWSRSLPITDVNGAVAALQQRVRLTSLRGVIFIDGAPAVALPTEAIAKQTLADIKAKAAARVTQLDEPPVFLEQVEARTAPAEEEIWADAATAKELLAGGPGGEPEFHVVRRGENPWVIARKYGMTVREFQRLNPKAKATRLRPGQRLRVRKEAPPAITVRVRGRVIKEIDTPFPTKIRSNPRLYVGKRVEKQAGRPGRARVTLQVTYENAKLVERKVLKREPLRPPREKIVVYGSKPRPRRR